MEITELEMIQNGLLPAGTKVKFDGDFDGCILELYKPEYDPLWAYKIQEDGSDRVYYRYVNDGVRKKE